jgi:hypothetical protein
MYRHFPFFLIFIILGFLLSQNSYSQAGDEKKEILRKDAVNFFLDCRSCDINYIRQEIPYVNYVRDTREAEVYLLVTDQSTGSGGYQFTYSFQGQGRFSGMNDTLIYTSNPDETSTVIREKKASLMKMGLMRYVARTSLFNEIHINHNSELRSEEVVDRWNNWVIELQTSPWFSSEETYKYFRLNNSVEVSKITEDVKFEVHASQNSSRQRYIEDDSDTTYIKGSESMDNLLVMSLGQHWSAGMWLNFGSSTWENYKFNTEVLPSLEYNLFPYSEATHKQLRFQYNIGRQYNSYNDTTLYNKIKESFYKHGLRIAYQVQEKWGSINMSLYGSHFLYDFSKNNLGMNGYLRIRIIKGLSLSVNGGVGYVNNRINLERGALTEAERLLQLKQQDSKYVAWGGGSLTYVFGSIYNNVVNPRFGQ